MAIGGRLGVDRQTFIRRHKAGEQVVDLPANGTARMRRFATGQSCSTDATDTHFNALAGTGMATSDDPKEGSMNLLVGLLVLVAVTAITVTAMLLVRRRAPEGSYFTDGDRASGVFGVLATGFSVLLGFIIFLSFASYDDSRAGAEAEATLVLQQVQTAQFLPANASAQLTGELVCYAQSVAGVEWDALDAGTLGDSINPWGARMFHTIRSVDPQSAAEQSAYDRWMDQTSQREQARNDRVHSAEGIMPAPLWLALFVICGVIFVYMLFFADRGEGAKTQAVLMGSVTVVITLLMMLVFFFDHPHGSGIGRLEPAAMQRALRIMDAEIKVAGVNVTPPCDEHGVAR